MQHNDAFNEFFKHQGWDTSSAPTDAGEDQVSCETVHPYVETMLNEFNDGEFDLDDNLTQDQLQFTACMSTQLVDFQEWAEVDLRDPSGQVLGTVPVAKMTYPNFIGTCVMVSRLALEFQNRWSKMHQTEPPAISQHEIDELVSAAESARDLLLGGSASAFDVDTAKMVLDKALKAFGK